MKQTARNRILATLWMSLFASVPILAADIEPPKVQLTDKMGVNMANGQVTHSLNTVSIGGAMGLSHSVSVNANEFNFIGYRGFQDKFYARARNVPHCTSPAACNPMQVMSVHDFSDSATFAYYVGGVLQQGGSATSGYTYVATSDERHTLEVSGTDLVWTKPDGTVARFYRGTGSNLPASQGGSLTSVVYPNGFTIWVNAGGAAVNTNTGFQIKHYFEADNRPLDKVAPPNLNAPLVSSSWQLINPKYIYAINASVEFCAWTAANCALTRTWPKATFEWPAGMPRTMYIGDSIVKVSDAAGLATTYTFRAYDLAYNDWGQVVSPYVPGRDFSPRLKFIAPPGGSANKLTYDYRNIFANFIVFDARLQTAGVTKTAVRLGVTAGYDMLFNFQGETQNYGGGGVTLVHLQTYFGNPGAIYYADTQEGRVWYEENGRNFVRQFDRIGAPTENYTYATRSNLTMVTGGGTRLAEYPATCTPSTRKTCNQPTRTRDKNGNWTDYTYHAASGQVESITSPADKRDILRPQTRFTYEQKYATYYNSAGSRVQSTQGIWLKTAERYCINSNASGGACTGGDEVVTTFEYNHPNLLLTGTLVSVPGGAIRRTCYRYDMYGNQIGVTTPNANLASCPAGVVP